MANTSTSVPSLLFTQAENVFWTSTNCTQDARVRYGDRGISRRPVDPDRPLNIGAQVNDLEMAEAFGMFVEQLEKTKAAAASTGTCFVPKSPD